MVVDQVLPDRHRVAATAQRLRNQLAVRLAGTRARRAARWGRSRSRWTPRAWPLRAGVGGHLRAWWPVLTRPGRWTPPAWWPVLAATPRPAARARAPGSRRPSDRRSPSRDGPRSPARCAAATIPVAPAPGLAAVCRRPRRCSSRRGTTGSSPRQRLGRYVVVAGFQVSISGRIWVSTEGLGARRRERLRIRSWCLMRTDSAATARAPLGPTSRMRSPRGAKTGRPSRSWHNPNKRAKSRKC